MTEQTELSVLTLNCWGLKFSGSRRDRITAIGHYLSDASLGYDIVGLQEVWLNEDFLLIGDLTKDSLPFSKHWASGLFGSGLVILSKYPILKTSLRRYALNGDPGRILHGDWFDGKSCASVVVVHPRIGEIRVFNTHLHATYSPVVALDIYLGCRLAQAWEMAQLIQTAVALGTHVIALGDINSAPNSLAVQLLTQYAGLTDSWKSLHPVLQIPALKGLSPEEGIRMLGITCDTPLNSWTNRAAWPNSLTKDPIGERLDYIFFRDRSELTCTKTQVVLQEKVAGIGKSKAALKHMSDHFAVHSVFSASILTSSLTSIAGQQTQSGLTSGQLYKNQDQMEDVIELLEHVLMALEQHYIQSQAKSAKVLALLVPMFLLATLSFFLAFSWIDLREARLVVVLSLAIGLSIMSSSWTICTCYGFFYGGETSSAFVNVIQEVKAELDYLRKSSPVSS
ncbi:phospholipase C type enzyme [Mortierella sp. AM989]|nr:phospholipase C type enzyme [Mortierella sp. AM989]